MGVDRSWRTADYLWLIDEVSEEPGVGYRIWHQEELNAQIPRDPAALETWLAARQIRIEELVELCPDDDPLCE